MNYPAQHTTPPNDPQRPRPVMTKAEAAEYYRVHENTIDNWRRHHGFPAYKVGNGRNAPLRFLRAAMDEWMERFRSAGGGDR